MNARNHLRAIGLSLAAMAGGGMGILWPTAAEADGPSCSYFCLRCGDNGGHIVVPAPDYANAISPDGGHECTGASSCSEHACVC